MPGFETEFSVPQMLLNGELLEVKTQDPEDGICRKNEAWTLQLTWSVWGDALNEASPIGLRDGEWIANAHLESFGKDADEFDFGPENVSIDAFDPPTAPDPNKPFERVYTAEFDIPADTLDVGLYRIAATIAYELEGTHTKARMAGFIEGGLVQIYEAP